VPKFINQLRHQEPPFILYNAFLAVGFKVVGVTTQFMQVVTNVLIDPAVFIKVK
jgi:hypothetical protein